MTGKKGRSGRKKHLDVLAGDTVDIAKHSLPELFQVVLDKAINEGNLDAAIYMIDRVMGRPRQEIDQRVKAIIGFTADDYELMDRIKANDSKVIEGIVLPMLAPVSLDNEPQKTTDNEQK